MIRVIHIGLSSNYGGIESFVYNYMKELTKKDIIFDFIDTYGAGLAKEDMIKEMGGKVYRLKNYKKHPAEAKRRMTEIIRDGGYKVVHIHMLSAANMLPVYAAISAGAVPIVHSHNNRTVGIHRKILHKINVGRLRKLPVLALACGSAAGKWMFGMEKDFEVIPNAIDIQKFKYDEDCRQTYRKKYGMENKIVLGHIGRIDTQKNHTFLIDVFKKIHDENPETALMLIGDGELRNEIEKKARTLGIYENIVFAGEIFNVNEVINAFDMFVFPSLFEGLGIVLIEAQANGLLCVASTGVPQEADCTSRVEYIDIDDPEKWSKYICRYDAESLKREDHTEDIQKAGYDISFSAEILKEKYMQAAGNL